MMVKVRFILNEHSLYQSESLFDQWKQECFFFILTFDLDCGCAHGQEVQHSECMFVCRSVTHSEHIDMFLKWITNCLLFLTFVYLMHTGRFCFKAKPYFSAVTYTT